MSRAGVVVMAYGTPASPGDVEAYYTDIRRGRPPSPEQLADLVARYAAIGGISPLAERTEAQRAAIERALRGRVDDEIPVVLGQKHAAPSIEDAIATLADRGVTHVVALVLAPHYSRASVGQYLERASTAGSAHGIEVTGIEHWHLLPAYVEFLTSALLDARATVPADHKILFTAHSLPERSLEGDPYPDELRATATAVATSLGLGPWSDWSIAWQSAGRTADPWRGPDILTVIRDLGDTGRSEGVVVCAQGFTSDHLEVLYDLDIEAARVADEAGLAFARTRSLNDDAAVMDALAGVIADRLDDLGGT